MNQEMVEYKTVNKNEMTMHLERDLVAITSSVSHESLTVHLFDISTRHESASNSMCCFSTRFFLNYFHAQLLIFYHSKLVPVRTHSEPLPMSNCDLESSSNLLHRQKRARLSINDELTLRPIIDEVQYLSSTLSTTLRTAY